MGWARVWGAAAVVLVGTCAGCSPKDAEPYRLPEYLHVSFRWSADPGIEVRSAPAAVVRGFVESSFVAWATNTTFLHEGVADTTYPGFRAFFDNAETSRTLYFGKFGHEVIAADRPAFGTMYAHFVDLDQQPDGGWRAGVCTWADAVVTQRGPREFQPFGANALNPHWTTLDFRRATDRPAAVATLSGPARYPTDDVFEGWVLRDTIITEKWSTRAGSDPCATVENPVPPELRNPQPFRQPAALPELPPEPGWPE